MFTYDEGKIIWVGLLTAIIFGPTVRDCLNHAIWNFATENPGFVVGRVGTGLAASIIGGPGVGLPLTGIAIIGAGVGEVGSGVKDPETFLKRLVKGGINDGPK